MLPTRVIVIPLAVTLLAASCHRSEPPVDEPPPMARTMDDTNTFDAITAHLDANPNDEGTLLAYARFLITRDVGIERLERLAGLDPQQSAAETLALAARLEPDSKRAETLARHALAVNPSNPDNAFTLAWIVAGNGDHESAMDVALLGLSETHHDASLLRILALTAVDAGLTSDAVTALELALLREASTNPAATAWSWHVLAEIYDGSSWADTASTFRTRVVAPGDLEMNPWPNVAVPTDAEAPPTPLDRRTYFGAALRQADDGVVVETVATDSTADLAGLTVGDTITSINGARTLTVFAANDAITSAGPGATLALEVRRDGLDMELTAELQSALDRLDAGVDRLDMARGLTRGGRYAAAYLEYARTLAILGYNREAFAGQVATALLGGSTREAARLTARWLEIDAGDADAHEARIACLAALGQSAAAAEALATARERFTTHTRLGAVDLEGATGEALAKSTAAHLLRRHAGLIIDDAREASDDAASPPRPRTPSSPNVSANRRWVNPSTG